MKKQAYALLAMLALAGCRDTAENPVASPRDAAKPAIASGAAPESPAPPQAKGGAPAPAVAIPGAAAPSEAHFTWTLPAGWSQGAERPVRLASFEVKDNPQIDVSLIMLAGNAGGKKDNIKRWYGQLGQQPPDDDALAKLQTIKILGIDSPLVEVSGNFGGGMGGEAIQNATLLGAICEMPEQALFIKMTGPAEGVKGQREAFVAFCLSLKAK